MFYLYIRSIKPTAFLLMKKSNILEMIPPETMAKVLSNTKENRDLLAPYLVSLTTEERKKINKVADGTESFVDKGISYQQQFPQFAPRQMDVDSMNNDYSIMTSLMPLLQQTANLLSLLSDTRMSAGAGTLKELLKYYNSVKQASKENVPEAKDVYADLSKRYKKKKKKPEPLLQQDSDGKDVHIA